MAAQAVGYQKQGLIEWLRQHHVFKAGNPVTPQGMLPVVLNDALKPQLALPQTLPMGRARIKPTGQEENFDVLQLLFNL